MSSIIKQYKSKGLNFTAYASSLRKENEGPYNVFEDSKTYVFTKGVEPNQWWQVSFQKFVYVSSYLIKTYSKFNSYPVSWYINTSSDNRTWKTVHTVNNYDTRGNTNPFNIGKNVFCKHFRIILIQKAQSTINNEANSLCFTFFDCYGVATDKENGEIYTFRQTYRKLIMLISILLLICLGT